MRAFVSLWSADLLDVGSAISLLDEHVDGFHIDIMDGDYAPDLVFGSDFVRAVCRKATAPVETHLMTRDADQWIQPFADAGSAFIAVHTDTTNDPAATLQKIRASGSRTSLALRTDQSPDTLTPYLELSDRLLIMGTRIGIKGVEPDLSVYSRVSAVASLRDSANSPAEIAVDGGIRRHTVPRLADAGAECVIPGSLVFGDPDPVRAVKWLHSIRAGCAAG